MGANFPEKNAKVSTSANKKAGQMGRKSMHKYETTITRAHDEMHTKVPSSICCHHQSAQLNFS